MAFIHGISQHTEQGYKYDSYPIVYPEQVKALQELRFEKAADEYWKIVNKTDARGLACDAIRKILKPDELQSEDFWHILDKRKCS